MRQLLDADLELVVKSGFVYLPLLFDPDIANEIRTPREANVLIEVDRKLFIKAFSLQSLVENYERIAADSYEQVRNACLQEYRHLLGLGGISISDKLRTILFHVLPHFIRRKKRLERRRLRSEEVVEFIGEKIRIPASYYQRATKFFDTDSLGRVLQDLEKRGGGVDLPKEGLISAHELREWLLRALEVQIVDRERNRLRRTLQERKQFVEAQRRHMAILLYIAEKGALEVDGFGFFRIGSTDDYLIYKRTGEYALKDFYGRLYLFPDCRVAVSTIVPLRPLVIDTYKHPFLEGYDSGQAICLRDFSPPRVFTAANVIKALREGINALLYSYSPRRRNGYHSLDRIMRHVETEDFDDFVVPEHGDDPLIPKRHVRAVTFDDYRISRDHPKIVSGRVEITNNYTP